MGIFVNQVGYLEKADKIAVATKAGEYSIIDNSTGNPVYKAEAVPGGFDKLSDEEVWKIDFSEVTDRGSYSIIDGDGDKSDSFSIGDDVYCQLLKDLSKALYYQRCGCALEAKYAGIYTHDACHTAPTIMLEDFVKKTPNPKTFNITGGWHDAGDFGRYTTAAAVAVGHILYAYELFPESFDYNMNIPESGNGMPDILNECMYELKWILQMQTEDGGVYHKHTAFRHAPFIMPEEDKDQFMLYPVSSMAVGDFVAVMALASRVYAKYDSEFSAKAIEAARKSFDWLCSHDYIGFKNYEGSGTGEYGDIDDRDERIWAAAEMLRTDEGDISPYMDMLCKYAESDISKTDFGWTDVSGFALLSVLTDKENKAGSAIKNIFEIAMKAEVTKLLEEMKCNGYNLAMKREDFVWGSNMVVLNRTMLLTVAAILSKDSSQAAEYKAAALEQLHYILGRNALNRSYVTGFGEHAYKNPHNRPTAMDGIDDPMPGWVSGGPFSHFCDADALKILPKGLAPMKCHADVVGSYSTNEITIYWNSPAIFVAAYFNKQ